MNIKANVVLFLTTLMMFACSSEVPESSTAADAILFERIGGTQKVRMIVEDIWHNHSVNPIVKDRFAASDPEYVKQRVFEIFAAATGASNIEYTGKDMKTAHAGMNISEMEFNAVVDDVLTACEKNKVGQQEQNEVLAIL